MSVDPEITIDENGGEHWHGFRIHTQANCKTPCAFHAPSDHLMAEWPKNVRFDRNCLVERMCAHGVGHPDPDSLDYLQRAGVPDSGSHGCDGCCVGQWTGSRGVMSPTREGRAGDSQAMPIPNEREDVQSLVIDDILQRRRLGIERYGAPLQPFNGRDALQDLYEELLDAAMYTKQKLVEQEEQHRLERIEECRVAGHEFAVIVDHASGAPAVIACSRCGRSWEYANPNGQVADA